MKTPEKLSVDWLVSQSRLSLHFLQSRYCGGSPKIAAALFYTGNPNHYQDIMDVLTDGGDEHHWVDNAFIYPGWFPMVYGESVGKALGRLNQLVEQIPPNELNKWEYFVCHHANDYLLTPFEKREGLKPIMDFNALDDNKSSYE